jgi:hypothetical protein
VWALPNRDTEDGPVPRRRYGIQAEPCVPIRGHAHALDQLHCLIKWEHLAFVMVGKLR